MGREELGTAAWASAAGWHVAKRTCRCIKASQTRPSRLSSLRTTLASTATAEQSLSQLEHAPLSVAGDPVPRARRSAACQLPAVPAARPGRVPSVHRGTQLEQDGGICFCWGRGAGECRTQVPLAQEHSVWARPGCARSSVHAAMRGACAAQHCNKAAGTCSGPLGPGYLLPRLVKLQGLYAAAPPPGEAVCSSSQPSSPLPPSGAFGALAGLQHGCGSAVRLRVRRRRGGLRQLRCSWHPGRCSKRARVAAGRTDDV